MWGDVTWSPPSTPLASLPADVTVEIKVIAYNTSSTLLLATRRAAEADPKAEESVFGCFASCNVC
jgi:hypothetical protein